MGGYGSGRWLRAYARETTNECRQVDIRRLHRGGQLVPGNRLTLTWRRGERVTGSVGIRVDVDRVVLLYQVRDRLDRWQEASQSVFLDWTACHYGGRRPWFSCLGAGCGGRRCAILYGVGGDFVCRRCADLRYDSQRDDDLNRSRERTQTVLRRLGGSGNLFAPFPNKPKRMHWSTYTRLWDIAQRGEMRWLTDLLASFKKSDAWLAQRFPELAPR